MWYSIQERSSWQADWQISHADFNRRLSYETAGMVFSDTKDTHFNTVDFFDKFHSDRFSDTQADEIADFFKENEDYDKRCEFMKFVFRMEKYTQFNLNETNESYGRVGYKT